MSPLGIPVGLAAAKSTGYQIGQSLRFDGSAYLNRTPSSAGNQKTWTFSAWLKRGSLAATQGIFCPVLGGDASNESQIRFFSSDVFQIYDSGGAALNLVTTAVYRDPSAWQHLVVVADTTQATAADRVKIYFNGTQVTNLSTANYQAQNSNLGWNNTSRHDIGRYAAGASDYFKGYMAEVHHVDGTALDPTDFGKFDNNGVWTPVGYTGSYGTNGFYLKFDPSATNGIGHDHSGNGNNWSPTGFTTSGTGTDVMSDTPTTNWCTLNPLDNAGTLAEGNLKFTASGNQAARATFEIPGSGKWYAEGTTGNASTATQGVSFGLATSALSLTASPLNTGNYTIYSDNIGRLIVNGTAISTSLGTFAAGTVLQFAYDSATGKGWFGKNNTWYDSSGGTTGDPATGANATFTTTDTLYPFAQCYGNYVTANFGQRAFAYTPPSSDFKPLNTSNLPAPTVKDGSDYFNTVLWTGNATARDITTGHNSNFTWIKHRSSAENHNLYDILRGVGNRLESNSQDYEVNYTDRLTAFNSDGFSLGTGYNNTNTTTYVGWSWAGGGSGTSNSDGSINSTISASPSSGFSIVTWTGSQADGTVGHGLGVAPSLIIFKRYNNNGTSWPVYHSTIGPSNFVALNETSSSSSSGTLFGSTPTAPTSTVFSVGNNGGTNYGTMVAYCFAEVEGYSKFGSYTGNGATTDGPFVYCGFKPAFVMWKRDGADGWVMKDVARSTYNVMSEVLYANLSNAESSTQEVDFLSNGFKIRTNSGASNTSGNTYVFMAFASSPFGGSGVSPATAR